MCLSFVGVLTMSDSKRVRTSSVAAFLFMPQFKLSMQGFSHIVPVFMRTMAMLFQQAGLIAPNHPATRYGMEGVQKYSFFNLIGEAWFTLRTTKAEVQQWGAFGAVVLMICLVVATVASFFLRVVVGLGASAQAQIFDNTTMDTTVASGNIPAGMFDKSYDAARPDLAIMLLDKIIRQGAAVGQPAPTGGILQQALGAFFEIYNTGVLMIAGVILFWIVLSVVVDTARTGTVGGGRHNMVWAPIRIVFALGLMIPLGTTGFSSGQYMVMKLAEWGSNYGSNAWIAYVTRVAAVSDILVGAQPGAPADIAGQYVGVWLCTVSYNAYNFQTTGQLNPGPGQQVTPRVVASPDFGTGSVAFTNETTGNLCGTVNYKTGNEPTLLEALNPTAPAYDPLGNFTGGADPAATYQQAVMQLWRDNVLGPTPGTPAGAFTGTAQDIACAFAAEHILEGLDSVPECAGKTGACGAGITGDGKYPAYSCVETMVRNLYNAINTGAFTGGAYAAYSTAVNNNQLVNWVSRQGWAGMGIWYHQISRLNSSLLNVTQPQISIKGGDITSGSFGGSEQVSKTTEILTKYNEWWKGFQAANVAPVYTAGNPTDAYNVGNTTKTSDITRTLASLGATATSSSENGFIDAIATLFNDRPFYFDVLEAGNSDTYPLASLAKIGNTVLNMGLTFFSIGTILSAVGEGGCEGAKEAGGSVPGFFARMVGAMAAAVFSACFLKGAISGPLATILTMLGGTCLSAGMLLKYYVPIIPFIRTAFAVLTWMISVFEAVVMVPIAALAHLTTEGEGLAGSARTAWILWLNVLMRPVLTVAGYLGALMIFNSFVVYFHMAFGAATTTGLANTGMQGLLSRVAYTVLYVGTIYTVANTCFKLLDLMPNAMMRWMGGSPDHSFDNDSIAEGFISATGSVIGNSARNMSMKGWASKMQPGQKAGATNAGPKAKA